MHQHYDLGEAEAAVAIDAMRAELARREKAAVLAVSDSHGELIALLRMDGAPFPSIDVAARKVLTAARERTDSGALGRAFLEKGWQMSNSDPRFTGWAGGVPVVWRGGVVGALAVSGLEQAEDEEIARLGAAAIAARLGA